MYIVNIKEYTNQNQASIFLSCVNRGQNDRSARSAEMCKKSKGYDVFVLLLHRPPLWNGPNILHSLSFWSCFVKLFMDTPAQPAIFYVPWLLNITYAAVGFNIQHSTIFAKELFINYIHKHFAILTYAICERPHMEITYFRNVDTKEVTWGAFHRWRHSFYFSIFFFWHFSPSLDTHFVKRESSIDASFNNPGHSFVYPKVINVIYGWPFREKSRRLQ